MKFICNNIKVGILFFFFILIYSFSVGQNDSSDYLISYNLLSVEDGLASREVYCALQDNDGFMWFGTRNGLNRFDGKTFQLFTKQKNKLKDNNIIQLVKDNNNHLIIAYGQRGYHKRIKQIDVMDLTTHSIQSLTQLFPKLPFDEANIFWIANDGRDICFLVDKPYQYWRLTPKGFELKCEMKNWDNALKKPNYITEIQPNWYYLFREGYAVISLDNADYSYVVTPEGYTSIKNSEYKIAGVLPDKEILWFKYSFGEGRYVTFYKRTQNGVFEQWDFSFPKPLPNHNMYIVQSGNYYDIGIFSPGNGLYLYNHKSIQKLLDASEFRGYESFFNLFTDNQNNKWFCTPTGVFKVKLEKNRFVHYFTKAQTGSKDNNQVRGIYVDKKGNLYANVWQTFYSSEGVRLLTSEINFALLKFKNSFFTGERHLRQFDIEAKSFLPYEPNLCPDGNMEICAIDSLSNNELLLGYTKSIEKFNITTKQITYLKNKSSEFPIAKYVYRFIRRKNKEIWAVAENGLFLLDEKAESVIDYWGQEANDRMHKLPFDRLHDAFEDNQGVFWLATNGDGLYRWDKSKNDFRQFNITAGFPSDILYRIEEDGDHNLWISTDNGLVRFNTKDYRISTYTTKEGITHNEFNKISSFKAADGKMYFGGLDGVNAFYPKDFSSDTARTNIPLRIISYSQFSGEEDELIDQTSKLLEEKKITLQPGDRFFNLEFKLLDFTEGKSSYTYKIEGIDKDWNFINQNSIRLSGLPYGNYTLRIRGQSQIGRESLNEITIPIEVVTPLFKKLGFQIFILILITAAILLLLRYRIASLKRNSELLAYTVDKRTTQLRETLEERDVLLKEIHHRVKNNLQVIVSLLTIHQQKIDSPTLQQAFAEAKTNVRSISLIHENLYQHDSLAAVDLFSFANDLFKLLNDLFNPTKENVNFVNNILGTELDIETAVPFGLVLNELITNSFKYAFKKNKELLISLTIIEDKMNNQFTLIYIDNGEGLPAEIDFNKTKTMGISLMRDLCRQMGGTVEYQFNKGSCYTIRFLSLNGRKQFE